MMQKRTLYSLLLTSFMLVCAFSLSSAQDVTFESVSAARCANGDLDITVNNPASISAFEIIFEVATCQGDAFLTDLDVTWAPGLTVLTNRIVDLSRVDYLGTDTVRIAGMMIDPGDACLGVGPTVVATIDFTVNASCEGVICLDGAVLDLTMPCCVKSAHTQFVDCATTTCIAAAIVPGTITVLNSAPVIDSFFCYDLHWGDVFTSQIYAHDNDMGNGCEKLEYYLVSGPALPAGAGLSVGKTSGMVVWPTTGADVGDWTICVEVVDSCGAADTICCDICIWNLPPEITCPVDTCPPDPTCAYTSQIVWGETATGTVCGFDPDGGPSPLEYYIISWDGPTPVNIVAGTGAFDWPTAEDNAFIGTFELCLGVTDNAPYASCSPTGDTTCCIEITVIPTYRVFIEKTHYTYQGDHEYVSVYLDDYINPPNEMGGFDFVIAYDRSALNFQIVTKGSFLLHCGWEYFTFRSWFWPSYEPHFFWGGIVKVVAMAEINNGANHPDCYAPGPHELFVIDFLVTDNRLFECMYVPIRFFWTDCGDNTISSVTGDSLFISRYVWDAIFDDSLPPYRIDDPLAPFPSYFGANNTCDMLVDDCKPDLLRIIDFYNGGVDIVCADSIDARGDINLNALAYEIADAVVFTNYFIYGFSAFHVNVDGQIAASDCNADGLALTVGDLVYLVRVIVGDAIPYPKLAPVEATYVVNQGVISVDKKMGAALVVVEGNAQPTLLANQMELKYAYDAENNVTRALVYSLEGNGFSSQFINAGGNIVSIEFGSYEGSVVKAAEVPAEFALHQNYPNPFNPTTAISFSLPSASDYTLTIYNVNGQEVSRMAGTHEAGVVELEWDAGELASGVYFYKLNAGSFTATKKMVLLK